MDIIENIDLEHQPFLSERLRKMHLNISDYTFANIYLFRNVSRYKIVTKDCGTFVSAYNRKDQNYIMPLSTLQECTPDTLKQLLSGGNFFFATLQAFFNMASLILPIGILALLYGKLLHDDPWMLFVTELNVFQATDAAAFTMVVQRELFGALEDAGIDLGEE